MRISEVIQELDLKKTGQEQDQENFNIDDIKDPDLVRHGDGAIAGCLMAFAAAHPCGGPVEFTPVLPERSARDGFNDPYSDQDDDDGMRGLY